MPTKILPPCSIPQTPGYIQFPECCVAVQTGEMRPVLEAALEDGVKLTVQQLRDFCGELNLAPPSRGSGKNGAVLKKMSQSFCFAASFLTSPPKSWRDDCKCLGVLSISRPLLG